MVKSFTIYEEYWDLITLLDLEEQKHLLYAITKYMFDDEEIELNDKEKKIFVNLKRPLNISKNNSKRSLGNGAPKGNNNASKTNQKQTGNNPKNKPENKPKTNVKTNTSNDVNVNVNGNVYVYVESKLNRTLNSSEILLIDTWDIYKPYQIEYAINQTLLARANSLKYTDAILRNIKDKTEDELKNVRKEESDVEIADYDWLNE